MRKILIMMMLALSTSGCAGWTSAEVKQSLKDFGIGELNCGKAAVANEVPAVVGVVTPLLTGGTANGQGLLDALFREAPELIACTVQNIVASAKKPAAPGTALAAETIKTNTTIIANGQTALDRWNKK